jgi:hypothetical protein
MSGTVFLPSGSASHVAPAPGAIARDALPDPRDADTGFASLLRGSDASAADAAADTVPGKAPLVAAGKNQDPATPAVLPAIHSALARALGPSAGRDPSSQKDADASLPTDPAAGTSAQAAGAGLAVHDPRSDDDRDRRAFSHVLAPAFPLGAAIVPPPTVPSAPSAPLALSAPAPKLGAPASARAGSVSADQTGARGRSGQETGAPPASLGESSVGQGVVVQPGTGDVAVDGQSVDGQDVDVPLAPAAASPSRTVTAGTAATVSAIVAAPPPPAPAGSASGAGVVPAAIAPPPAVANALPASSGAEAVRGPSSASVTRTAPKTSPEPAVSPAGVSKSSLGQPQAAALAAAPGGGGPDAPATGSTGRDQGATSGAAPGAAALAGARATTTRAVDSSSGTLGRASRPRAGLSDAGDASSDHASTADQPSRTSSLSTLADGAAAHVSQGALDDGGAKTVTVVTKASPAGDAAASTAGERLRDALVSVANHAVLRGPATGHIDVPELGRVAVRAHSTGGAVDVDVTADRSDTRAMLRGHLNEMGADLHQGAVPVARLTVDRANADPGNAQGLASRDHGAAAHDSRRDRQAPVEQDDDATTNNATRAAAPKRVRIVL